MPRMFNPRHYFLCEDYYLLKKSIIFTIIYTAIGTKTSQNIIGYSKAKNKGIPKINIHRKFKSSFLRLLIFVS